MKTLAICLVLLGRACFAQGPYLDLGAEIVPPQAWDSGYTRALPAVPSTLPAFTDNVQTQNTQSGAVFSADLTVPLMVGLSCSLGAKYDWQVWATRELFVRDTEINGGAHQEAVTHSNWEQGLYSFKVGLTYSFGER